jgi:hypothetical protein
MVEAAVRAAILRDAARRCAAPQDDGICVETAVTSAA